jgi:hypothetical protein
MVCPPTWTEGCAGAGLQKLRCTRKLRPQPVTPRLSLTLHRLAGFCSTLLAADRAALPQKRARRVQHILEVSPAVASAAQAQQRLGLTVSQEGVVLAVGEEASKKAFGWNPEVGTSRCHAWLNPAASISTQPWTQQAARPACVLASPLHTLPSPPNPPNARSC